MKIYTDGICEGNPGERGIGIVMEDGTKINKKIGYGTNNEAECIAVITALENLKNRNIYENVLFTDSELIVRWVNGNYQLKSNTSLTFVPKIRRLLSETRTKIKWIPREENEEADEESKKSLGYSIYHIESKSSKGKYYNVVVNPERKYYSCDCPDFQFRKNKICKHIREVK